jgi:hypothetical protein
MGAPARAVRVMHAALVLGVILAGAVLVYRTLTVGPSLRGTPILGYVTAAFALVNLAVAAAFLLPRIPNRSSAEAPDDYWSRNEVRTATIIVWAVLEGSGLIALVGYYLTGGLAPVIVAALAFAALAVARPARIEGG